MNCAYQLVDICLLYTSGLNASESVLPSELVIKPRSVEGRYYVGGVIGANVVELNGKEVTAGGLRAQNSLGVIRGQAFVGGVIGYQRTYRADQIDVDGDKPILEALAAAQSNGKQRLLPGLDDSHVPTAVQASTDQGRLVLTAAGNTDDTFTVDSNNIPIQAGYYLSLIHIWQGISSGFEGTDRCWKRNIGRTVSISRPGCRGIIRWRRGSLQLHSIKKYYIIS